MTQNNANCYPAQSYHPAEESDDFPNVYYSETEAFEEVQEYYSEDFQELYTNKTNFVDQQGPEQYNYQNQQYNQNNCYAYPEESYYEIMPPKLSSNPPQPVHRSCVPPRVNMQYYQQPIHHSPSKAQQYCPGSVQSLRQPQHNSNLEYGATRSRSAHPTVSRHPRTNTQYAAYYDDQHFPVESASGNGKKRPVTAKTPKYYKPPPTHTSRKKASALSLPVASQPDPSLNLSSRRHRKSSSIHFPQDYHQYVAGQQNYQRMEHPHVDSLPDDVLYDPEESCRQLAEQMHSEGDVPHQSPNNFDKVLDSFEEEIKIQDEPLGNQNELAKFVKYLKPRVPATIRARQQKQQQQQQFAAAMAVASAVERQAESAAGKSAKSGSGSTKSQEKPSPTTLSLEKLLNQLQKCEPPSEEILDQQEAGTSGSQQDKSDNDDSKGNDEKDVTAYEDFAKDKSFNYDNISSKLSSMQNIIEVTKLHPDNCLVSKRSSRSTRMTTLDDTGAMELHRSKSYIVALIDRALSKELGTVPDGKTIKHEFQNMSPKKAISIMNRHSQHRNQPKELCYEITAALTDSILSAATAPEPTTKEEHHIGFEKTRSTCCMGDAYIRQLRQLRWGHIKHIQHEVKKLEDLERFLECFSGDS